MHQGAARSLPIDQREHRLDHEAVLSALPDPVVVVDADARIVWANLAAEQWSGWQTEEWRGRPALALVHPDDLATALISLGSVQDKSVGTPIELRFADRAGSYRRFEVRGRPAVDVPGVDGVVLVLRDVTERRRWEVAGGHPSALQAVLDQAPAITMVLAADGSLRSATRALTALLGYDLETTAGRPLSDLVCQRDARRVCAELAAAAAEPGSRTFEAAFVRASGGEPIPLNVTVTNLLDDRSVEGMVATAVDITLLVEARARLHHLATHDVLTGLPNRTLLLERLRRALVRARRRGTGVGLIYCDLDGFKAVNDRFGHAAGDAALVEVARRLEAAVRESDTVARVGGDEFVVVVEGGSPGVTDTIAARIDAAVRRPVQLAAGEVAHISISCGVVAAGRSDTAERVLAAADSAMFDSKRRRAAPPGGAVSESTTCAP
jgi:diguanylate cyclase (GGDEF)-like protein/PAS domain S-box-containing protein